MLTRNRIIVIVVCCLAPWSALAAYGGDTPGYAEAIATPAPAASDIYASMPDYMPCGDACGWAYPPRPTPWYYWWQTYHGRGIHYAYLPPVPGWYYFRPYSLGQLRTQQRAVQDWGGDPRNPYSNVEFQSVYPRFENRPIPAHQ